MAKKQMSFADKAARHGDQQDYKTVKYIKSEQTGKNDSWRFNESYVKLFGNENIDQAIARVNNEAKALAEEFADIHAEKEVKDTTEKVEAKVEEAKTESSDETVEKPEAVETEKAADKSE